MNTTPDINTEANANKNTDTDVETDSDAIVFTGTLVLIRHGERADQVKTDPWYKSKRVPRRRDPPLTSRGHSQALHAAAALNAFNASPTPLLPFSFRHTHVQTQTPDTSHVAPPLQTQQQQQQATIDECKLSSSSSLNNNDNLQCNEQDHIQQDDVSGVSSQDFVIYSSPLTRCLQTAAHLSHILQARGVHVIYSLAKSCKYFRTCATHHRTPKVPTISETRQILHEAITHHYRNHNPHTNPNPVPLLGYTADDGTSASDTLRWLVRQSRQPDGGGGCVIVAGHSESQGELARLCGLRSVKSPFCGRATFSLSWRQQQVCNASIGEDEVAPEILNKMESNNKNTESIESSIENGANNQSNTDQDTVNGKHGIGTDGVWTLIETPHQQRQRQGFVNGTLSF